jgi:hypothetical protein
MELQPPGLAYITPRPVRAAWVEDPQGMGPTTGPSGKFTGERELKTEGGAEGLPLLLTPSRLFGGGHVSWSAASKVTSILGRSELDLQSDRRLTATRSNSDVNGATGRSHVKVML